MFVFTTIGIIIFSTYMLSLPVEDNDENQKLHNATKQGLLGFIIAIFSLFRFKSCTIFYYLGSILLFRCIKVISLQK